MLRKLGVTKTTATKARLGLRRKSTAVLSGLVAMVLATFSVVIPANAVPSTPGVPNAGQVVAEKASNAVVINEIYAAGGSAGQPYTNKFVELANLSGAAISVDGWSVQYQSASGTGATSGATLSGNVPASGKYLVQLGSNGSNGAALPTPDASGTPNLSSSNGVVILSNQGSLLTGLTPSSAVSDSRVVDLVGYGSASLYEGAAAPPLGGTRAVQSLVRGGADTNNNAADFSVSNEVTPENSQGPGQPSPTATATPTETPTETPTGTPTPGTSVAIADIQGTGATSPLENQQVTTRGIVTAAYPTGGLNGYFIQTPGTGGDVDFGMHKASDAIFVFSAQTVGTVKVGDYVEVTGQVTEYKGLTEITVTSGNARVLTDPAEAVKPVASAWPKDEVQRESLEGMLLAPEGDYYVSDNYSTNQYADIGLALGPDPVLQPTEAGPVNSPAWQAAKDAVAQRVVRLDDGASTNFLNPVNAGTPLPYLSLSQRVVVGAKASFSKPVIVDYRNDAWRLQPLEELTAANADSVQPASFEQVAAPAPPEVSGNIRVSSFNVLNYFTTTGDQLSGCRFYTDRDGAPTTVRSGCDARGAANAENLQRQQDKIVAAINALGANVVSLEEIENSAKFGKDRDAALSTLVDALNAAAPGTWAFAPTPSVAPPLDQEDFIRTAFIYKKAEVTPVGESTILDDRVAFVNARKPLAQVFRPVEAGAGGSSDGSTEAPGTADFLVIVNHFKSKGSPPDSASDPNADRGDGQGAWNQRRVEQAQALVAFANDMKAKAGTENVILSGDFNSYSQEDPLRVLRDAGYVDAPTEGTTYTYLFGGMLGSLDHVFMSAKAREAMTTASIWNINATQSVGFEYSRYNANVTNLYQPDALRSSDHNPEVVGFNFGATPPAQTTNINLLATNDFHGRINENTVNYAGTVEELRAENPEGSLLLGSGDLIGASSFASRIADDVPTMDVLNTLEMASSAVGNHELDRGEADLTGRVTDAVDFPYLAANIYRKGTTETVFDPYLIKEVKGVRVAIIGAAPQNTPTLVPADGVAELDFGDPVEAINRVAATITSQGLADVIVANYHDGAGVNEANSTLEQAVAQGGVFASIVQNTSPDVDVIFNAHTHQRYSWNAPVPGDSNRTRPVIQSGEYGAFVAQVKLNVDAATGEVTSYESGNVARSSENPADLAKKYPRVTTVKGIVDAALAKADEINVPWGSVTADITTAFRGSERGDITQQSTLGYLIADMLASELSPAERGGAQIGLVNPGGLRDELYYGEDGVIRRATAESVLPFNNDLMTGTLSGTQLKELLEQQWQKNDGGAERYLALSLSSNVRYTFDSSRELGNRITGMWVAGKAVTPEDSFRLGSFSFLFGGGDGLSVLKGASDVKGAGIKDIQALESYLKAKSPLSPDFVKRGVEVRTDVTEAQTGDSVSAELRDLNLKSLGAPATTEVSGDVAGIPVGTWPVQSGSATVSFKVPAAEAATEAEASGGAATPLITSEFVNVNLPILVTLKATTPEPSAAPGGDLPNTGATMAPIAFGAVGILAFGAVLLLANARRKARH